MKVLQLTREISVSDIKKKMESAIDISEYKRWQVLLLVKSYKVDADYIADITGYSKPSIYSIVQMHNKGERTDVSPQKRGGRRRSLMSLEQEASLLTGLEKKALSGQILSYLDIKSTVEKEVGRKVSDDFIWDLFKRNGWTKHSPRPHHPKKDQQSQDDFKKNSPNVWLPPTMNFQPH